LIFISAGFRAAAAAAVSPLILFGHFPEDSTPVLPRQPGLPGQPEQTDSFDTEA